MDHNSGSSALLGAGRRASTLRSRVRALRSLLLWIRERHGLRFYFTPFPLIDYLQELVEQGKSRGSIKAVKSAASFGEYVAGIDERDRVTKSVIFQSLYAEILASASPGAALGPAPRPFITLLWALENAVSDSSLPLFIRVMGWWKCLQAWAALRHDDHREISLLRSIPCVASCGAPRLPAAIKWSSLDPSLSRPWPMCTMQASFWLDGSFSGTFVRRHEIFFFQPRPAERSQLH